VSTASLAGAPAATTAARAEAQLGGAVAVYLDAGPCTGNVTSTILDLTGTVPRMLRAGAIGVDDVRKVVPVIDLPPIDEIPVKPAEPHPLAGEDAGTGS